MGFDSNFSVENMLSVGDLCSEISQTALNPEYSSKLSLFAAAMSQLAYTPFEQSTAGLDWLNTRLDEIGFHLIAAIALDGMRDAQCFIAQEKRARFAVIAHRGTTGIRDWINNLKVDLHEAAPGFDIHKGFLNLIGELVVDPRYVAAMDQIDANARIVVCGHSLGGALAKVQTLLNPPENFFACYTIGAPRIGRIERAPGNCNRIFRVVNDKDIVPRLPFALLGYRHCGRLIDCNPIYSTGPKEITGYRDNPAVSFLDLLVLAGSLKQELRAKLIRYFINNGRQSPGGEFGFFDVIDLVARELGPDWDPDFELSEQSLRTARGLMRELIIAQPVSDHDALAYISELR